MLESRVVYNGISYKAKREYIYCFNRDANAYDDPHSRRIVQFYADYEFYYVDEDNKVTKWEKAQ